MQDLKLAALFLDAAGLPERPAPAALACDLRRLNLKVAAASEPKTRSASYFEPNAADQRSRNGWSRRKLVREEIACSREIYSYGQSAFAIDGNEAERLVALRAALEGALRRSARGELSAAATIAAAVRREISPRCKELPYYAITCDQLLVDRGDIYSPGVPEAIRDSQRRITEQYVALGSRVGKSLSMSGEAFLERSQAFVELDACGPSARLLKQARASAKLARDTVLPHADESVEDAIALHVSLYIGNRVAVDAREDTRDCYDEFRLMIDIAERLGETRLWIATLRAMSRYFLELGWEDEAAECLAHLTHRVDEVDEHSVFTVMTILLRLAEWMQLKKRDVSVFITPFWALLRQNPQRYFKSRFELKFGALERYVGAPAADPAVNWWFASRCANGRFFSELFV